MTTSLLHQNRGVSQRERYERRERDERKERETKRERCGNGVAKKTPPEKAGAVKNQSYSRPPLK